MAMSDQARRGWLMVMVLVMASLLGLTIYTIQQNQSFKVTLAEARTALLAAQAARTEAEARALLPAEALAVAALPSVDGAVIRGVDEISSGIYRIWRRVPATEESEEAGAFVDEWWRSESATKTAVKIFDTRLYAGGEEPLVRSAKTAEGGFTLEIRQAERPTERFVVLTLTPGGDLLHALDVEGLVATLKTSADEHVLRFALPETGCPVRGNLPITTLESVAPDGASTALTLTPPVILSCQGGAPTGTPWTTLAATPPSPENTATPSSLAVWRLPLTSVGERDRYLEMGLSFDPATLFVR